MLKIVDFDEKVFEVEDFMLMSAHLPGLPGGPGLYIPGGPGGPVGPN